MGIEYSLDSFLRGYAGKKTVMVNNQGYRQSESVWEAAEPGSNVVLTIDLGIQQAAETALKNGPYGARTAGAVVVMDVNTGDVLAMASSPTFDPNFFVDRKSFPPNYYKRRDSNGRARKKIARRRRITGRARSSNRSLRWRVWTTE